MSSLPKVDIFPLCLTGQGQGRDNDYKGSATLCADTEGAVQGHDRGAAVSALGPSWRQIKRLCS